MEDELTDGQSRGITSESHGMALIRIHTTRHSHDMARTRHDTYMTWQSHDMVFA